MTRDGPVGLVARALLCGLVVFLVSAQLVFAQNTTAPSAPPPSQAPPLPYRYAGQIDFSGNKLVLLMRNERGLVARVGDILEGTYRVDDIVPHAVYLTHILLNVTQKATATRITESIEPHRMDFLLTAPTQVARGSVFEIGAAADGAEGSVELSVGYDVQSLQLLSVGSLDAPTLPTHTWSPGTVSLKLEAAKRSRAAAPIPIRFLAIGDAPGSTQIVLSAVGRDHAGHAIETTLPQLRSITVVEAREP